MQGTYSHQLDTDQRKLMSAQRVPPPQPHNLPQPPHHSQTADQGISPPHNLSDPCPPHTEEFMSLSDRPELHKLDCFRDGEQQLKIIKTVGVDWKELGLALRFDYNLMKAIENDAREKAHECCRELLHRWLNGEACQPITWARLIEALGDAEHSKLARELKKIISS